MGGTKRKSAEPTITGPASKAVEGDAAAKATSESDVVDAESGADKPKSKRTPRTKGKKPKRSGSTGGGGKGLGAIDLPLEYEARRDPLVAPTAGDQAMRETRALQQRMYVISRHDDDPLDMQFLVLGNSGKRSGAHGSERHGSVSDCVWPCKTGKKYRCIIDTKGPRCSCPDGVGLRRNPRCEASRSD